MLIYLILIYNIYIIYKYCFLLLIFENALTSKRPRPKVQNCVFESLFFPSFLRIIISCKIRAKNRLQKVWFFDVLFAYTMNFSYLCIVNQKKEAKALARENLLVGRQKIVPCPARKNGRRKEDEKVKKHQSKKGKKNLQANV